jgi:hypothetical protein
MSWTQVVVYPPPSQGLPHIAALFHNQELLTTRAAPTLESAEKLMAVMMGELSRRIREKTFTESE